MNATLPRKQSKSSGQRSVRVIESRPNALSVLVADEHGGALYDLAFLGEGTFSVQKLDADGVNLGAPYTATTTTCTCKGFRHGYACRHTQFLAALDRAGKLPR